jgi:phosphohistidine phosphatase SixA
MLIYLMRHGAAQLQAESDQARQLTPQGQADNQAVLAKLTVRSISGLSKLHKVSCRNTRSGLLPAVNC